MTPPHDVYRVLDEATIVAAIVTFGWPRESRTAPAQATAAAHAALERWIAAGLPVRRVDGRRYFDSFEVLNHARVAGLAGQDAVFVERTIPTWREFVRAVMDVDQPPTVAGQHTPARLTVLLRREFWLPPETSGPVRLRVPLPYVDATQTDLQVDVLDPPSGTADVRMPPGRLEVRWPTPPAIAVIEVRATVTAWQQSCDLTRADPEPSTAAPDAELYLRPREGLIRVTPFVRALADRLAGGSRSPGRAVAAFWDFFFSGPLCGPVHHELLDPADPLEDLIRSGRFDCFGGTSLLIALCRARGIPARLIQGVIPHDPFPAFHFWAEVWIPPFGWTPVDLASWDLAAGRADAAPWSRLYLGRMDHRIKYQCFPHLVVGPIGVSHPARWTLTLTPATTEGSLTTYYGVDPFRPLYRDQLAVRRAPVA